MASQPTATLHAVRRNEPPDNKEREVGMRDILIALCVYAVTVWAITRRR